MSFGRFLGREIWASERAGVEQAGAGGGAAAGAAVGAGAAAVAHP